LKLGAAKAFGRSEHPNSLSPMCAMWRRHRTRQACAAVWSELLRPFVWLRMQQVIAEERDTLARTSKLERVRASFYATTLVLAYFLDHAAKQLDAKSDGWARCASFASDMLLGMQRTPDGSSTWNSFFLDGERLSFDDNAVSAAKDVVGEAHPLGKMLDTLLQPAAKAAAAAEEEWPDEAEVRAARIADAQQSAPVPERVWAMRNAAGTARQGCSRIVV